MSESSSLLDALVGSKAGCAAASPTEDVRAVAWARVSTDMQEERGLSIPEQIREIRIHAEKHGIEIIEEFSEAASAYQNGAKRVEFDRMLARAKSDPQVSAIIVHDFSRFSRDSVRAKTLLRELRQSGIRVISLNDPEMDPETVSGVYMEAITLAKNEAFSREVAFHTRKGCRANVQTRDPETGWCYKNGGQPLWGYRSEQLVRGEEKRGRPIVKSIWVLDDTIVAGRPVHEWVRYMLVEMAAKGASVNELRDFCNRKKIPARRKKYWGHSTWVALLQPHALLKYCGHEVWNVHRKNGTKRPPSEWVVVENAHEAIITEDEARAIALVRRGFYYVCGSQPYRKGMGCGPGVYVPQAQVEAEVLEGLKGLLGVCTDPKGFTRQVNEEIRRLWEESTGHDPQAEKKVRGIDHKIANIRRAIEDGLSDAGWANERLKALMAERETLIASLAVSGEPPQIDTKTALSYRRQTEKLLRHAEPAERKRLVRTWVEKAQLAPERLEVEITYRIPEPIMNNVVAGAGFEPATFGL